MPMHSEKKLVIAISSRALFDLTDSHKVYMDKGLAAYSKYQIERESQVLKPGDAFILVKKLLNLNQRLGRDRVEIVLMSRNSADTGLRIFNSIQEYDLNITRAAFSSGESPYRYIEAFACDLFLSLDAEDVQGALKQGIAAATLLPPRNGNEDEPLRFAFAGDAVLLSDESSRIYIKHDLKALSQLELACPIKVLTRHFFKAFLYSLQLIQTHFSLHPS